MVLMQSVHRRPRVFFTGSRHPGLTSAEHETPALPGSRLVSHLSGWGTCLKEASTTTQTAGPSTFLCLSALYSKTGLSMLALARPHEPRYPRRPEAAKCIDSTWSHDISDSDEHGIGIGETARRAVVTTSHPRPSTRHEHQILSTPVKLLGVPTAALAHPFVWRVVNFFRVVIVVVRPISPTNASQLGLGQSCAHGRPDVQHGGVHLSLFFPFDEYSSFSCPTVGSFDHPAHGKRDGPDVHQVQVSTEDRGSRRLAVWNLASPVTPASTIPTGCSASQQRLAVFPGHVMFILAASRSKLLYPAGRSLAQATIRWCFWSPTLRFPVHYDAVNGWGPMENSAASGAAHYQGAGANFAQGHPFLRTVNGSHQGWLDVEMVFTGLLGPAVGVAGKHCPVELGTCLSHTCLGGTGKELMRSAIPHAGSAKQPEVPELDLSRRGVDEEDHSRDAENVTSGSGTHASVTALDANRMQCSVEHPATAMASGRPPRRPAQGHYQCPGGSSPGLFSTPLPTVTQDRAGELVYGSPS
ncbi:hypothetical protein CPLU01_06254 [Colletotrichum plurivorum]|uniref:Uncharacterized protein n=1 Tax=Colletotrichum plurivorum TaxID=2175906 RepID=A0A8H6KJN2_9PEZI|nr:hypothetical protein CPLU01_06254 [Colletotrichum plurivorum]